jgi:hypothetical protein
MPAKKKNATHSHATHVTHAQTEEATIALAPSTPPASPPPAPQPASSSAPLATGSSTPATAKSGIFLPAPPPSANIPAVPSNFIPKSGTTYRGISPLKAELVALPLAVNDLAKFTRYAQVFGGTAPPYAEVLQCFEVTNQWSSMRTSSSAWDAYCESQEGICWTTMRATIDRLRPAFLLAATTDPSLATQLPGLYTLLDVKKGIAQKGAATKRANKKAIAEGKAPVHGKVGKQRKKAADKAILASVAPATTSAAPTAAAPAPTATATPVAVTGPVTVAAPAAAAAPIAPVANGAPPPATPASGGTSPLVNGVNGTGH